MGEYTASGAKMGTCEDMYYLRASQRFSVTPDASSLNPADPDLLKVLRFRFPFPDEDGIGPGGFDDYSRGLKLHVAVPADVSHGTVQFTARPGYLVSLPCPEGPEASHGLEVGRNGFAGNLSIVQQGFRNGHWALICRCCGCGRAFNLPTAQDAAPIVEACLSKADRAQRSADHMASRGIPDNENGSLIEVRFWKEVASRILAGYAQPVSA